MEKSEKRVLKIHIFDMTDNTEQIAFCNYDVAL